MSLPVGAAAAPPDYVRIFDTTLRDGEQSPGASLTSDEKLEVARALSRLGVDVIEAGFPAASPDDLLAVQRIATLVGKEPIEGRPSPEAPIVCALARATTGDIDAAWRGVSGARRPRIHTFLATSPIHREHKLSMSREQVKARVSEMVRHARSLCEDVEFSPEDAGRTEPEFLYEVLDAAIAAGATTLNIPDTVGYTTPDEFGALIAGIFAHVPGVERTIVSVHCHDDLGLAVANSLAGVRAGARQVEVAVNGIGERAGNAALEEVVMALATRRRFFGLRNGVDTTQLVRVSRLVSTRTGLFVQPNKAIVGANAFAHESGIHQDGMLKNNETYEIMRPETVGAARTELVLGKHSGRHAFSVRLREMGYELSPAELDQAFARFKALADRKKAIFDADLEVIVNVEHDDKAASWVLDALQVACGTIGLSTATVRLRGPDGAQHSHACIGTGPVDAVFRAIDAITQAPAELLEYTVQAVTEGIDALGEVGVRIRGPARGGAVNPQLGPRTRTFQGHGADTDIIVASANAYLSAVNRLVSSLDAEARTVANGDGTRSARDEGAGV